MFHLGKENIEKKIKKITITQSRAELICIKDEKDELKKSIQTKRKLKKALGEKDESI